MHKGFFFVFFVSLGWFQKNVKCNLQHKPHAQIRVPQWPRAAP